MICSKCYVISVQIKRLVIEVSHESFSWKVAYVLILSTQTSQIQVSSYSKKSPFLFLSFLSNIFDGLSGNFYYYLVQIYIFQSLPLDTKNRESSTVSYMRIHFDLYNM